MNDIFETELNSVNVGDKFCVSSKDTKSRWDETQTKYIVVTEICVSSSGYVEAKYNITNESFRGIRGCGSMPVTLLTGEECCLGNGRFQYFVSKLN